MISADIQAGPSELFSAGAVQTDNHRFNRQGSPQPIIMWSVTTLSYKGTEKMLMTVL